MFKRPADVLVGLAIAGVLVVLIGIFIDNGQWWVAALMAAALICGILMNRADSRKRKRPPHS